MAIMTPEEIRCFEADRPPPAGTTPLEQARNLITAAGLWADGQQMGRRWPIGCVALEITQRCNLDCTLCYLSEQSEAVHDIPLGEIFRRIELIHRHYGPNTDVQITGGDPTLRKPDELLAIVRQLRKRSLRPTLMTNGIKATRPLLEALVEAGLIDVAFHVDTTQQLKGYHSETALNAVRRKYIERTRGLPLSVFFNTTIHRGNFHEIPELVRFFTAHADVIRTASFQLQADTGRGVLGRRDGLITPASVARSIEKGAGTRISFDAIATGHPACNHYGLCLEINGRLYDFFDDADFIARLQDATADLQWDRTDSRKSALTFLRWLLRHPLYLQPCARWSVRRLWEMRRDLLAARGHIRTLSFFIHNFMDASALDSERIHACVFKTMTADGPVSMCMHNAKRDHYILKPVGVKGGYWQPLNGKVAARPATVTPIDPNVYPLKRLKGRTRQAAIDRRLKKY